MGKAMMYSRKPILLLLVCRFAVCWKNFASNVDYCVQSLLLFFLVTNSVYPWQVFSNTSSLPQKDNDGRFVCCEIHTKLLICKMKYVQCKSRVFFLVCYLHCRTSMYMILKLFLIFKIRFSVIET